MGTSSAKTIRASGRTSLHNRPDIRLQPCLLKRHTHEFLQSGRRPYKIPYGSASSGSHPVFFEVHNTAGDDKVVEKSVFLVPR